jgi:hypothetical protein
MELVTVVIPIYNSDPTKNEIKSFKQCLQVLEKHPISIICPENLDVSVYKSLASGIKKQIEFKRFKDCYFSSIEGYSRLLLSMGFYNSFKYFEYILIYQLDAWVFHDGLEYWCHKGFDYIGSPWFENFGSMETGDKLWTVGNGGFSLRKTASFLEILNYKKPLFKIKGLKVIYPAKKNFIRNLWRIFNICINRFSLKNTINYYIKNFKAGEDTFWSIFLLKSEKQLKIPNCEEAISFSFERSPAFLFELNGNRLPFGCHAWWKHDYDSFWRNFIQTGN